MNCIANKFSFFYSAFPGKDISSYHACLLVAGILAIAFAFGIFSLDRSPTVWYDETFCNDPAYQLAYHGKLVLSLEPGVALRDQAYLGPPLHPVFQAAIFRIFGFGIWQVRLPCLFFHLFTGIILFLAAKTYFRYRLAGLFSMTLFLFDPAIVESWHSSRLDAMAVFLGILALYLLIYTIRSSSVRGRMAFFALAGIIAGLSCITHIVSLSFAVAGVILLLFDLKTWKERTVAIALYGIGGTIGITLWVIRILTYPNIFAQQFLKLSTYYTGISGLFPGLTHQVKHLAVGYKLFPFLVFIQIGGLIWGLKSSEFRSLSLAGCWALLFYFAVIRTSHPLPYVAPIMILGAGGLAIFYVSLLSKVQARSRAILILLAFFLLVNGLGVLVLRAFATVWQWEGRSHSAFVSEWREKIPYGASVAAPPACWYAALANNNSYRYYRVTSPASGANPRDYIVRIIKDNVEYLVLPSNVDIHNYLPDEYIHLFPHVDDIRRPMRHLIGIEVGSYNFDIHQRMNGNTRP